MNRPIKFRAWDRINELMHEVEFVRPEKEVGVIIEDDKPIHVMDWSRVEVTEFTGLKDSNGTEIYHKDIVKYGEWKYVVAWDRETASFILEPVEGHIGDYFEFENNTVMKVIGNVYEDKNLLEKETA